VQGTVVISYIHIYVVVVFFEIGLARERVIPDRIVASDKIEGRRKSECTSVTAPHTRAHSSQTLAAQTRVRPTPNRRIQKQPSTSRPATTLPEPSPTNEISQDGKVRSPATPVFSEFQKRRETKY